MTKKINRFWEILGIILILIVLVVLFLISIGKIDLFERPDKTKIKSQTQEPKIDTEKLKREKKEKEALKKRLGRRSSFVYNFVKYSLALIYLAANILGWLLLWNGDMNDTIGNLVNYNEAIFLIYLFFMLVVPKKPLSISNLSYVLKRKISQFFYHKYQGLVEEIKILEKEIERYSIPKFSRLHPHG